MQLEAQLAYLQKAAADGDLERLVAFSAMARLPASGSGESRQWRVLEQQAEN